MILTTGYNNLPLGFIIVLGTIIDPSPSINPAKYPPSNFLGFDKEESKVGSDVLFNLPTS